MAAEKYKIRTVEKNEYRVYLKKAAEFFDVMGEAHRLAKWNAVGLNAVHCAISSADAMLVFYAGIRSAGESHLSVVEIFSKTIEADDVKARSDALRKIIAKKNLIEYENRDFSQREAIDIAKQTERFYKWILLSIG